MSWEEWGPSPGSSLQRASSLALAALIMMRSRAPGTRRSARRTELRELSLKR